MKAWNEAKPLLRFYRCLYDDPMRVRVRVRTTYTARYESTRLVDTIDIWLRVLRLSWIWFSVHLFHVSWWVHPKYKVLVHSTFLSSNVTNFPEQRVHTPSFIPHKYRKSIKSICQTQQHIVSSTITPHPSWLQEYLLSSWPLLSSTLSSSSRTGHGTLFYLWLEGSVSGLESLHWIVQTGPWTSWSHRLCWSCNLQQAIPKLDNRTLHLPKLAYTSRTNTICSFDLYNTWSNHSFDRRRTALNYSGQCVKRILKLLKLLK